MSLKPSLPFILFLLFFAFSEADACSCTASAPCNDFGRADVVFLGKVVGSKYQTKVTEFEYGLDGSTSREVETTYDIGEVYFEVEEGFRGAEKGSRVTIHSIPSGSACGAWFKRGQRYVVFARKEGSRSDSGISSFTGGGGLEDLKPDESRLWTSLCSGNRQLSEADETLLFLRSLSVSSPGGTIVGTLYESIRDYSEERVSVKAYAGVEVRATDTKDPGAIFNGKSDADGRFVINAPPGNYIVAPELPSYLDFFDRHRKDPIPVEINAQKCAVKDFYVLNGSRVSGKVVDSEGRSVELRKLDLVPVGKQRGDQSFDYKFAIVDGDGKFSFDGVPVGKYYLSLNYATKPDDDSPYPTTFLLDSGGRNKRVLDIGLGTKIEGLNFILPGKYGKRQIKGKVVWKNGRPANGAEVELIDVEFDRRAIFGTAKTDAAGNFTIEWFTGRRYKLSVVVWQKTGDGTTAYGVANAESEEFVLGEKTKPFRIVLDQLDPNERSITRSTVRTGKRK